MRKDMPVKGGVVNETAFDYNADMFPKRRPVWEQIVLGWVIGGSLLLSLALYARRDNVSKTRWMHWELMAHRQSVIAFFLTHKQFPTSLQEAAATVPLIDPFGHPYFYDPNTGWVN